MMAQTWAGASISPLIHLRAVRTSRRITEATNASVLRGQTSFANAPNSLGTFVSGAVGSCPPICRAFSTCCSDSELMTLPHLLPPLPGCADTWRSIGEILKELYKRDPPLATASHCQFLPRRANDIVEAETPNLAASDTFESPDARISSTFDCVSFACGCTPSSTARVGELRPFRARSQLLSACVPSQRCSGFTQQGTSHEWQTDNPSGIGP